MFTKQEIEQIKNQAMLDVGNEYTVKVTKEGRVLLGILLGPETYTQRRKRLVDNYLINNQEVRDYGVRYQGHGVWDVTSDSGNGVYTVELQDGELLCTCPYADHNTDECNHIARVGWFALAYNHYPVLQALSDLDYKRDQRAARVEALRDKHRERLGALLTEDAKLDLESAG